MSSSLSRILFSVPARRLSRSALLLSLLGTISLTACTKPDEPENPSAGDMDVVSSWAVVCRTDSDEWRVQIFKEHLLYSEAAAVSLPAPWVIPSREDAAILRQLSFQSEERFVTCDGYTFGMPSASVSKAGSKTKYSVLGLWRRRTTIVIEF